MRIFNLNEESRMIRGFPGYEVTNYGRVFNLVTEREMTHSVTMQGDPTVGLMRDGHQYRRMVKSLVAVAFVEGRTELFNCPVQLDGNKLNLHAENIVWRPRWFAHRYTRQFKNVRNWYFFGPVVDLTTGDEYTNCIQASIHNGILADDVRLSIYNSYWNVFPTRQRFAYVQ